MTLDAGPPLTATSRYFLIFSPTPPLVASLKVIATLPSARFWRVYSTPPSSLTLTSLTLKSPLMVIFSVACAVTQAENFGGCSGSPQSPPKISQTIRYISSRICVPTCVVATAAMMTLTTSSTPMYSAAV